MAVTAPSLSLGQKRALAAGIILLLAAFGGRSWLTGLVAIALLAGVGWRVYTKTAALNRTLEPWPWPADFRAPVEAMARPIDPTPKRLLPPHKDAEQVAKVATTPDELARMIADKPVAWPWAVFTSVLVQRRNAVQMRLRMVASGYQPHPGIAQIGGQSYSQIAYRSLNDVTDLVAQGEQFMLSPAFKGAFGDAGAADSTADPDAIVAVAHRLMDYHDAFLAQAEGCLQTPVEREILAFVQDMGAFALCPLIGYQKFIPTMCARIAEAQELLPYSDGGTLLLDDVNLEISLPDGLSERVLAHIRRFNP